MKFIFADSLDVVDPGYDFVADRNSPGRSPYWDDVYSHEILGYAPFDGMLVSRGIVGGDKIAGKYSEAQAMRFRRVGARAFLRLDTPEFEHLPIFGDCGAFTYHKEELPPYTSENMAEFYEDGGFTHGCSVDHIIFDFDEGLRGLDGGTPEARRRFDLTVENAEAFLRSVRHLSNSFTPLGVIQGWSPGSMAEAARRLCAMGYSYLALGGTVPLKSPQIRACLGAIREAVPAATRIHVLGFREGRRDRKLRTVPDHEFRHDLAPDPGLQGREGQLLHAGRGRPAQILHRDPGPAGPRKSEAGPSREAGRPQSGGTRPAGTIGAAGAASLRQE